MPERILFCADNLFNKLQYPQHVVSANETAAGFSADYLGNGRRQAGDRWQSTTANADAWPKVNADVPRASNFILVDRASNWRGRRIILQLSNDDFAGDPITVADVNTIPTVPGGVPSSLLGCVTDELTWFKTFIPDAAYDWRVVFKAAGAGIVPQITQLWLGTAWLPTDAQLNFPVDDHLYGVAYSETLSSYGWAGRSRVSKPRKGNLIVRPANDLDYEAIQFQVLGLYAAGFPAWLCYDRDDGGRDLLQVRCPSGDLDWGRKRDWPFRGITIPFIEDQVAIAA